MDRFEYYTYVYETEGRGVRGGEVNEDNLDSELNKLGADGWELVSSVPTHAGDVFTRSIVCIFKRKLP